MNYERIAGFYDRYVKWDLDVPFFVKETEQTSGEVLELMSGTGRLSLELIKAGIKLVCVDSSGAMLKILEKRLEENRLFAKVVRQDVCELNQGKQFEKIILPFHSFAEITGTADQNKALNKIYQHLAEKGRFICTLHNPVVRLKSISNQLHLLGQYQPGEEENELLVWSAEHYDPASQIVRGVQIYEEFDGEGTMLSRSLMNLNFCLLNKAQFEEMAVSAGFKVEYLYGDYACSSFNEETSPVMIFGLGK